jgi:general secretion pathway protein D
MKQRIQNCLVFSGIWMLSVILCGCEEVKPLDTTPTFAPKTPGQATNAAPVVLSTGPTTARTTRVSTGPAPPSTAPSVAGAVTAPPLPRGEVGIGEAATLEQMPLPQFIDEVFVKALKLNVQVDPAVMSRSDTVTLRTARRLSATELLSMAEKILAGYGIGVVWNGEVMHIAPNDVLLSQMPVLIRSRALPEIPLALRPIFQVVHLTQVSTNDMMMWLQNAYGTKIKLFATPSSNSIMIFGLPDNVAAAVEAVRVLDQPRLAGRRSLRVSPVYWDAKGLASKLADVLRAEGYDAGVTGGTPTATPPAILIVPVEANNSVLVFAPDPVLAHVRTWATDLDTPQQSSPSHNIFIYQVQNTTAASLGATVEAVLHGGRPAPAAVAGTTQSLPEVRLEQASQTGGAPPGAQTAPPVVTPPGGGAAAAAAQAAPRLVIDQGRNALIFIGSATEYDRVRPLLEALDKATREALIEVTVIELDLNNSTELGLEFALHHGLPGGYTIEYGTTSKLPTNAGLTGSTGLSTGSAGFNFALLNNVQQARLLINAFAQNGKMTVLSTPRILAKSGGEAKIDVGTQVPVVTSQGSTNVIQNAGTTGILQSIQYVQTGVLLNVKPVVHSGNRIDLTVSQEVSQALPNPTPGISSPLIQNRKVSTQVTMTDGQTVVIGGLITENRSNSDSGVPYLKDVPGLGLLFRNQSDSKTRSELLVFITPYVVSDSEDARRITDQFREDMQRWPIPSGEPHW